MESFLGQFLADFSTGSGPRRTGSPGARRQYEDEGYAIVRGFFSAAEAAAMGASFDRHWREGMAIARVSGTAICSTVTARTRRIVIPARLVQWPSCYVDPAARGRASRSPSSSNNCWSR